MKLKEIGVEIDNGVRFVLTNPFVMMGTETVQHEGKSTRLPAAKMT